MSFASTASTPVVAPGSGQFPTILVVQGGEQREIPLRRLPFTIGRKTDRDLVIADPRVSRQHAELIQEDGEFFINDLGSKQGTFVNGLKVTRQKLARNDRIEFGVREGIYVIFHPATAQSSAAREFLSQIHSIAVPDSASDLEKLTLFLEAARKLNTTGALDDVLITLIESTLRLTGAERGFVFLRSDDGDIRLAAGRSEKGEPLVDDRTISRSIVHDALNAASDFLVTDTTKMSGLAARQSIVAQNLRTVICIPLRKPQVQEKPKDTPLSASDIRGVLYLDSRFASGEFNKVSHDILRAIATEAAALVENAYLVQAQEEARRYQQELSIASTIHQGLMAVTVPDVPYAALRARSLACREIGGDFYDVVLTEQGLSLVVTDVSGKGISAAILASTMQGMIYSQLVAGTPLAEIMGAVNRYLCQKNLGNKYATVVVAQLKPTGEMEYVNCGHVPPLVVQGSTVVRTSPANIPVGLLPEVHYESARCTLRPGDRVVLVTDGVTEAENPDGDFYGDERLEKAACSPSPYDEILSSVQQFCRERPLGDDCTVVELTYKG